MSNANSQPRRGPRTRQRHASQDVWKYTSPEDYAPTNAEEERSPNASAVTSASGSQPPRSNASSRVNQLHSQQASTSSNISQGKRTATKRKRAADERSGALQGGERSSKRKRASPRLAEDELKSRRSMASPRESARSLQQAASPSVYDSHTVHWEDSYLVAYDHSSASGSQVEGPSSRPHGVIDTFPGPNVYTPFTADSLLCASASPSEVNSRPRSYPSLSTAGLQATGGAANIAGPSTTRASPTSLLQHTLFWNQTPQDFSSSAPSQAVHDALASSPASAIGSALSDTPRSWSAASAATQSASDQPSRRAPAHAHTRDHTDRAGPSGGRRSVRLEPQASRDTTAGRQSSVQTSSRGVKSAERATSKRKSPRTNAVQPAARSSPRASLPSVGPSPAVRAVQPSHSLLANASEPSSHVFPVTPAYPPDPSLQARNTEQRPRRKPPGHWLEISGLQGGDVSAAAPAPQMLRQSPWPSSAATRENTRASRSARRLPAGREAQRLSLSMPPPRTLGRTSLAAGPSQPMGQRTAQPAMRSPENAAQQAFLQSLTSNEWQVIRGERLVVEGGWGSSIGGVGEDCWVGVVGADGLIYQTMLPIPCRGRCPIHRHDTHNGAAR